MIDDGHLFIVTKPEETAALIEAFLADLNGCPLSCMTDVEGFDTAYMLTAKQPLNG